MNAPVGRAATGSPARERPKVAPAQDRPWRRSAGELVAGKYALVEPLGQGGMAEVWVARHEELRSLFAIKFLDRNAGGDEEVRERVLERFRFEAQISARLSGRTMHVAAVHDAGTHESTPYVVMELVRGESLEGRLDRAGVMEPAEVARLLDQLADALSAAHEIGIVHRDVKPSNVLLFEREEGGAWTAKLADFGIAKAFGADQDLDLPRATEEGLLVGSPAYMSPEQISTDTTIDGRSDLWSVGVMVYEALTGWPPFGGRKLAEIVVAISTKTPEPPSTVRATLGAGIDAWMAKALAKRPEERFQTAAQMAMAFHDALAPITQAPPPPVVKRSRLLPIAAAAAVAVGVVAVASRFWTAGPPSSGAASTPSASAPDSAAPQPPPVAPRDVVAISPPPGSPEPDEPPRPSADTQSTAAAAEKPAAGGRPRPAPKPSATATAAPRKEVNPSETF